MQDSRFKRKLIFNFPSKFVCNETGYLLGNEHTSLYFNSTFYKMLQQVAKHYRLTKLNWKFEDTENLDVYMDTEIFNFIVDGDNITANDECKSGFDDVVLLSHAYKFINSDLVN